MSTDSLLVTLAHNLGVMRPVAMPRPPGSGRYMYHHESAAERWATGEVTAAELEAGFRLALERTLAPDTQGKTWGVEGLELKVAADVWSLIITAWILAHPPVAKL